MKQMIQYSLVCCLLLGLFTGSSFGDNDGSESDLGHLPQSWLLLPENDPSYANKNTLAAAASEVEAPAPQVERALSNMLDTNDSILAHVTAPIEKKKWKLTYVLNVFSVGASGLLGILSGKGTQSVTLWWRRKSPAATPAPIPTPTPTPRTATVSSDFSEAQLAQELEPAIAMALTQHRSRVRDPQGFRAQVLTHAREFLKLAKSLDQVENQARCWWPYKLRADLAISASGAVMVAPVGVLVGGEIFTRLEWIRIEKKNRTAPVRESLPQAQEVNKFVQAMITNLERVAIPTEQKSKFVFDGIRVAIGAAASGTIYVAKVQGSIVGHLYFRAGECKRVVNPVAPASAITVMPRSDLWMEAPATEAMTKFATREGIHFKKISAERALYLITAPAFQQGLKRAMKMSDFFMRSILRREARHADNPSGWEAFRLWSGHTLSLTGTVGVASVSGNVQLELEFTRK